MKDSPDNPQAFPFVCDEDKAEHLHVQWGMSLRDWFAGQALAGFMASQKFNQDFNECDIDLRRKAWFFYRFADAMLKERELK